MPLEAVFFAVLAFLAVVVLAAVVVFFAVAVLALLVVFFPASALAALRSEDCVTPVALAISFKSAWVSSLSPLSALASSPADRPLILRASCSWLNPAAVRASLIRVPTFFAISFFNPFVCFTFCS